MKTTAAAFLALLCGLAAGSRIPSRDLDATRPVVDASQVAAINADPASTFRAALDPRFASMSVAEARRMFGLKMLTPEQSRQYAEQYISPFDEQFEAELAADTVGDSIPETFDARDKWPGAMPVIENQERCGSCWAYSATEVLSARFAIQSNNATHVLLAPQDPVSCDSGNMGCQGGMLPAAWAYMKNTGVVTTACMPYTAGNGTVAPCPTSCTVPGVEWKKYHAKSAYAVGGFFPWSRVKKIQMEIMAHGPVQTGYKVYQNFMSYSSGVYNKIEGDLLGGHAVMIFGWGTENGTPYWLVRNSWGASWPTGAAPNDEGNFKILRGKDLCGIEADVYAGLADA